MKKLFFAFIVATVGVVATPAAKAQSTASAAYSGQTQRGSEQGLRKKRKTSATDIARMQQRMSMNPDEAKRDQQLEILEARSGMSTANTSFGRASGPARQFEKGAGGFTVRKFKDNRVGTARQKRGQTRAAGFVDPKGKPLTHKKKKRFLFF
ncbi:hypothetical protein MUN84_08895 [Hymenobacter sp. 5516J-16]|uniref:hypothetical protein n=1 Tax=Hymenobacter sp. 5516J-16 TaxID=2932253 RepID=UPI001FD2C883|nr:hypothetical protein [Hymenobacter sp. 5516J-16]UOQ78636.1 hypothetical protein MUN84_08895 [Hymenobacter sp. 5516J-16]